MWISLALHQWNSRGRAIQTILSPKPIGFAVQSNTVNGTKGVRHRCSADRSAASVHCRPQLTPPSYPQSESASELAPFSDVAGMTLSRTFSRAAVARAAAFCLSLRPISNVGLLVREYCTNFFMFLFCIFEGINLIFSPASASPTPYLYAGTTYIVPCLVQRFRVWTNVRRVKWAGPKYSWSLSLKKPSPSPGFWAQPGPHITIGDLASRPIMKRVSA